MKRIIVVFLSLVCAHIAFADCPLTVIAESGLRLRKGASLKSEVLKVVEFGEIVWSKRYCSFNYPTHFANDMIEIDGKKGFWMKVRYGKIWGYMFSAYLVAGDIFPYCRNDTVDNVVVGEIFVFDDADVYRPGSFDYRLYTPRLNWYGVVLNKTNILISKVHVTPIYNDDRWDENDTSLFDVGLQVENDEEYDFLFGSKKELEAGIIELNFYQNCEGEVGVFLYPEQEFKIPFGKKQYVFRAYEDVVVDEKQQIVRRYTISLFVGRGDEVKILNKEVVLKLHGDAKRNAAYKNPKLYWSGDLNQDGDLDFIFLVTPMIDQCGAVAYFKLLYSAKDQSGQLIYKANDEVLYLDNFDPGKWE